MRNQTVLLHQKNVLAQRGGDESFPISPALLVKPGQMAAKIILLNSNERHHEKAMEHHGKNAGLVI
jgi:hypothetical protein